MSVAVLARFGLARAAAIIITDYQRKGKGMVLTLLQLLQGILLAFLKTIEWYMLGVFITLHILTLT